MNSATIVVVRKLYRLGFTTAQAMRYLRCVGAQKLVEFGQ